MLESAFQEIRFCFGIIVSSSMRVSVAGRNVALARSSTFKLRFMFCAYHSERV